MKRAFVDAAKLQRQYNAAKLKVQKSRSGKYWCIALDDCIVYQDVARWRCELELESMRAAILDND